MAKGVQYLTVPHMKKRLLASMKRAEEGIKEWDYSPRWEAVYGGPYRGGTELDPLLSIPLYGMNDPNAGLLSVSPTTVGQKYTDAFREFGGYDKHLDTEEDRMKLLGDEYGVYRPYYNEIRIRSPGFQPGYTEADADRTFQHELYHPAFQYYWDNPSLIPDASFVSRGPNTPLDPARESARGLLEDYTVGQHKLIGAMSPDWMERVHYSGQENLDPRRATTADERWARRQIVKSLGEKTTSLRESFKKKPKKKERYTRPR
jgi:hypothetical protein